MRKYMASLFSAAMVAGSLFISSPAEAATIRCATADASKRKDGSYDLLVSYTNYPRYTGKPFSFRIKISGTDLTGGRYYKTYTFVGTARSYHTPKLASNYPRWETVESWQSGTKCVTAVR